MHKKYFMPVTNIMKGGVDIVDEHPTISVIMPTYNSARYLASALCSILEQDFSNFEVLVVDDHSTDASAKIASDIAQDDCRVRCLTNRRSKGVSGARNTGLDSARGEWIAFLDSDDLLTEESLSSRMEFLARTPRCRILATDHSYIDEDGSITVERRFSSVGLVELARQRAITFDRDFCLDTAVSFFLDEFCLMWTGSVLLHRSVVERVGRFDETMTHGEDSMYWFQAALHDSVYFLDNVTAQYRQSAASASADTPRAQKGREDFYRKLLADKDFFAYHAKATRRLAIAINEGASYYRGSRRFGLAVIHALRALFVSPICRGAWRNLVASALRRP